MGGGWLSVAGTIANRAHKLNEKNRFFRLMVESAHLLFAKIVLNCHSAVTVYLSMTSVRRLINIGYVLAYLFLIKNQQLVSKLYYLQVFLCVYVSFVYLCFCIFLLYFCLLLRLFYVCVYFCVRLLNFIPMCKKSPAEKSHAVNRPRKW